MAEQTRKTKKKICIGDKVLLENKLKGEVCFIGEVRGKSGVYYGIYYDIYYDFLLCII